MIEIPFNQYNIEEIKYKISDTKSVIVKLRNWSVKDIEIVENNINEKKVETVTEEYNSIRELINKASDKIIPDIKEKRLKVIEQKKLNDDVLKDIGEQFSLNKKSLDIIRQDAKLDGNVISERNKDRNDEKYFNLDPNDDFSKIETVNDLLNAVNNNIDDKSNG